MSNESRRIEVKLGDTSEKNIKFKLEQNVKTMEILSLKLTQEDVFKSYNADYGVVIGRVLGNGAVGIPNAKVSIFIPLDSIDETNPIISSIYPYKTPQDKNQDNKRYNLLPRLSKVNKPRQPFGSFPSKEEFLCNDDYLYVYEKYYKYSTITNNSGDYMLFGVPTGSQIIHMSVDITDIGDYSMSPISMVTNLGYSPNLFSEDGTRIKEADDLSELPHIETQDIALNVIPFWGDENNFDIGITRQDFKISAEIQPSFTIFGSCITMGVSSCIGNPAAGTKQNNGASEDDGFYAMSESNELDVRVNRLSKPKITLLTYDSTKVPDMSIVSGSSYNNLNSDGSDKGELVVVDGNSYAKIINDGEFALVVACNRRKVITDSSGMEIEVDNNNNNGVYTRFAGSILIEDENVDGVNTILLSKYNYPQFYYNASPRVVRGRFKIPQGVNKNGITGTDISYNYNDPRDINWRKSYQLFESGKFYSISQFFPTRYTTAPAYNSHNNGDANIVTVGHLLGNDGTKGGGMLFKVSGTDNINEPDYDRYNTITYGVSGATTGESKTFIYEMEENIIGPSGTIDGIPYTNKYFGAQWLNMCLAFPQTLVADGHIRDDVRDQQSSDMFTIDYFNDNFKKNNEQPITGNITNTENYVRPTAFQTDFIVVNKNDIDILNNNLNGVKGINKRKYNLNNPGNSLTSTYKYRQYNQSSGAQNYVENAMELPTYSGVTETIGGYIFKGMYNTDCITLIKNNGLI